MTYALALRAPDYINAAARLIAAHGWCGSCKSGGLNLVRAVVWAVADRQCAPRELSSGQAARVDEVLEHLEGPGGLNMAVSEYERTFASATASNVAWELELAAWRYANQLAPIS